MEETISMHLFTKRDNRELFRAYLKLKYEVFADELGWSGLGDPSGEPVAREDPYDNRGYFILAEDRNGLPAGVLRAIALQDGFPHQNLFENHVIQPEFAHMICCLCSLNALAVLPPFRGKACRAIPQGWGGSLGRLLMLGLMRSMEEQGMRGAILTAGGMICAGLFLHLGFLEIDAPTITPLHPVVMTNMGIVFGSEPHIFAEKQCGMGSGRSPIDSDSLALLRYFQSRHQKNRTSPD